MQKEYGNFYKEYTAKYGVQTAIFMMVGSFYELYDIQDPETGDTEYNVKEITDCLGIQLSVKKGEADNGKDTLFAGIPESTLHKWAKRLTGLGWTVVVVDQIKDSKGDVKKRAVARILSPSTHVEAMGATEVPYVACIYFHSASVVHTPVYGVSLLDLTTGTTITYSGEAHGRADVWTADELVQILHVHSPKEVLVYWHSDASMPDECHVRRVLGLTHIQALPVHCMRMQALQAFGNPLVRQDYLRRIYNMKTMLPPKEYLGLRSQQEEISLVLLLQFVEEHAQSMVKCFHTNQPWVPNRYMICGNHALTQLQQNIIVGIFNQCKTPMGKRAIQHRLLRPLCNAEDIERRLNEVEQYATSFSDILCTDIERQLRFMYDLPRLHRKILCGMIQQEEFYPLHQTYMATLHLLSGELKDTLLAAPFCMEDFRRYITGFHSIICKDKAIVVSADKTPFSCDKYPAIGRIERKIEKTLGEIDEFRMSLCRIAGVSELRLESREREPFGIKGTRAQLVALEAKRSELPRDTKFSSLKSGGGWIESPTLTDLNGRLIHLRAVLAEEARRCMSDACRELAECGEGLWQSMEEWIAHIDCTQCIARVSREKGYVRPTIVEADAAGARISIEGLRHPLVEANRSLRVAYTTHDMELDANSLGHLVYGMNASGKSTLMKAVGIACLLAQAGCYVPVRSMRLSPFRAVYTRILNQDNIFAGLSSFAVEMSELRDILRSADEYSLVLGDELCAGTESQSAQALVASGIQWLLRRRSKFIFATHLHDLPDILDTATLGLKVWHLHVEYDPDTGKLVYDRSLRPGSGSSLYGLEVARALDLPFEFIQQAVQIRNRLTGKTNEQGASVSSWNTSIVRKSCSVCGCDVVRELEVHHIRQRNLADKNGILPDGTHMNHASNLTVLCEACHDKCHSGEIEIGQPKMTSEGPKMSVRRRQQASQPVPPKTKWSEEEMQHVVSLLETYRYQTPKVISAKLHSDYGIKISEASLRSIRRDMEHT